MAPPILNDHRLLPQSFPVASSLLTVAMCKNSGHNTFIFLQLFVQNFEQIIAHLSTPVL
jgi:hypothetical protein